LGTMMKAARNAANNGAFMLISSGVMVGLASGI
jgi:hypothetical protein